MLETQGMALGARNMVAIAGLAEIAVTRDRIEIAAQHHDAAIERRFHAGLLKIVSEARIRPDGDPDGGQETPTIFLDRIAERVAPLDIADQARAQPFSHRKIDIGFRSEPVETSELHAERAERIADPRLLGDEIDCSARLTATEKRGGGALQHFDPLDPRRIALASETTPAIESVDEIAGRNVLVAREAANGKGIPQAAKRVLARDRRVEVERIVQPDDAVFPDRPGIDDIDGLRNFGKREITAIGLPHTGDDDGSIGLLRRHDR